MAPLGLRAREIQQQRAEATGRFPALWERMVTAWSQPGTEDRAWLMYSASYLLRTGGVHWAMDPVRLEHRVPGAPVVEYASALAPLSLVVLTHRHSDHLDIPLIRCLSQMPITWVVPAAIRKQVISQGEIDESRIIVPKPMHPIEMDGIRITPFEGMHWEKELGPDGKHTRGVPALGYLVGFNGKRWLFPGDTRTYDASLLPAFGPVDGLFAHVWLGRGCASETRPAALDAFCRFFLELAPRQIVLTHLREFGRVTDEYWDLEHAQLAAALLRQLCPTVTAHPALMGDDVAL